MNAIMRTIELMTTCLAPILYGQLFNYIGYIWTGAFIAGSSLLSFVFEYMLLNGIYSQYPRLAHRIKTTNSYEKKVSFGEGQKATKEAIVKIENESGPNTNNTSSSICGKIVPKVVKEAFIGWKTYFEHSVRYVLVSLRTQLFDNNRYN